MREEGTAVSCLGSQTLSPLFITIVHSHSTFNKENHRNLNHSLRLSLARRTVAALVRCSCCLLDCLLFTVRPLEPAAPAGTGPAPVYTVYSSALYSALCSTAVHCTVQCTVQQGAGPPRQLGRLGRVAGGWILTGPEFSHCGRYTPTARCSKRIGRRAWERSAQSHRVKTKRGGSGMGFSLDAKFGQFSGSLE